MAAFAVGTGHAVELPESDAAWAAKLQTGRSVAMANKRVAIAENSIKAAGYTMPAKQAAPAATKKPASAAKPTALETVVDLAKIYNRHLKTSLKFTVKNSNIYASAGLNPDSPDGDFLILWVENRASIVFDIRAILSSAVTSTALRPFVVDGQGIVLAGNAVLTWASPERDSTLAVARNLAVQEKWMSDPFIGKNPEYLLKPFTMLEFRNALWAMGTPVPVEGSEIRFYYGDAVERGEKRLIVGKKKGFAFIRKIKDEKYEKAVLIAEEKLPVGGSLTLKMGDDLTLRLVRVDQNNLKVSKEN